MEKFNSFFFFKEKNKTKKKGERGSNRSARERAPPVLCNTHYRHSTVVEKHSLTSIVCNAHRFCMLCTTVFHTLYNTLRLLSSSMSWNTTVLFMYINIFFFSCFQFVFLPCIRHTHAYTVDLHSIMYATRRFSLATRWKKREKGNQGQQQTVDRDRMMTTNKPSSIFRS